MRTGLFLVLIIAVVGLTVPASGDLQNVQVGGSIRIHGDWYLGPFVPDKVTADRWPALPGRLAVTSPFFGWNDKTPSLACVEQRTTLNVKADFTDQVTAFIELDSYDIWGEDFRSNYLTGVDNRSTTGIVPHFMGPDGDVEVYQAYIETREMFGTPLRLRIGRQELKFGSGWLVAPNDVAPLFFGTSFDGVRLTYATDQFSVDGFWTKLVERSPVEEDGDVDFYGVYASYLGIKDVTLDAYWLFLRDAQSLHDTNYNPFGEWVERVLGVDKYGPTNLHTVGLRGSGKCGPVDFEAEAAYQFGDADQVGFQFAGAGSFSPYGPSHAHWNTWGANLEVGYNFNLAWTPRIFVGGVYLGGEDNRDVNFCQWLGAIQNPFWRARPSVSFNRLFSHWKYSEFLDASDFSNAWILRTGASVNPTESLRLSLTGTNFHTLSGYTPPLHSLFSKRHISWLAPYSFLTNGENDADLGWEVEFIATYKYSADLTFEAGWSHLFLGDGASYGNFSSGNGLLFNGGTAHDDANYGYLETRLTF